jgi:hypothetical protein
MGEGNRLAAAAPTTVGFPRRISLKSPFRLAGLMLVVTAATASTGKAT